MTATQYLLPLLFVKVVLTTGDETSHAKKIVPAGIVRDAAR